MQIVIPVSRDVIDGISEAELATMFGDCCARVVDALDLPSLFFSLDADGAEKPTLPIGTAAVVAQAEENDVEAVRNRLVGLLASQSAR